MPEKAPRTNETLFFATAREAGVFRERLEEAWSEAGQGAVDRRREAVAEVVGTELAAYGESVQTIRQPWEHTQDEHREAQVLVDLAFVKDLGAALSQARQSGLYPRNLDLFHDLLTNEMYELVKETKLNKQPLTLWVTELVILLLLALAGVLVLGVVFWQSLV